VSTHPKVAVPAARSTMSSLKTRRRIVLGALLFAAAAGLFAAFSWVTYTPPKVFPSASAATPTVALATQVAREYFAGVPTTVAYANGVDPTFGFTDETRPFPVVGGPNVASVVPTIAGEENINLVRFYVALDQVMPVTNPSDGEVTPVTQRFYYQLGVPMSVPDAGTPVLAATPTLQPFVGTPPESLSGVDPQVYPTQVDVADIPDNSGKQLVVWAQTFASEGFDSEALQAVTGDTDPFHEYSGMGGWVVTGAPKILGANIAPASDNPDDPNPGGLIIRVGLVLTPPAANGPTVQSEYDVWVAGDGTEAQPPVIAWAPAGTYDLMYPYMNARTTG
jgi:hypothetical protein